MSASPADPASSSPDTVRDVTMWSVIDVAVGAMPDQVEGIDQAAMRLCMTLHCATSVIFYDLNSLLRRRESIQPAALKLMLIVFMYREIETRDLIRMSGLSRATASALLDTLSKQGFVERRPSGRDRRTQIVTLSEQGRETFVTTFAAYNDRERFWAQALSAEEQGQLIGLLDKLVSSHIGGEEVRFRQ